MMMSFGIFSTLTGYQSYYDVNKETGYQKTSCDICDSLYSVILHCIKGLGPWLHIVTIHGIT